MSTNCHSVSGMSQPSEPPPWARRPGESAKAYRAFDVYRELPPAERSLFKTAEFLGHSFSCRRRERRKPPAQLERWSAKFAWVERARAWDDYWLSRRQADLDNRIREMNERHAWQARAIADGVVGEFSRYGFEHFKPREICGAYREMAQLERVACGLHPRLGSDDPTHALEAYPLRRERQVSNGVKEAGPFTPAELLLDELGKRKAQGQAVRDEEWAAALAAAEEEPAADHEPSRPVRMAARLAAEQQAADRVAAQLAAWQIASREEGMPDPTDRPAPHGDPPMTDIPSAASPKLDGEPPIYALAPRESKNGQPADSTREGNGEKSADSISASTADVTANANGDTTHNAKGDANGAPSKSLADELRKVLCLATILLFVGYRAAAPIAGAAGHALRADLAPSRPHGANARHDRIGSSDPRSSRELPARFPPDFPRRKPKKAGLPLVNPPARGEERQGGGAGPRIGYGSAIRLRRPLWAGSHFPSLNMKIVNS